MRMTCLQTVYELARKDDRIVFIGSDLGFGTLEQFRKEMPDRFFMEGVSEASIVGMAAGLALSGKIVYVNTIATFLTRRCYEQVVLDLCLHNANVRLIGNGGGVVYAPLGPTHEAIEDIAIFRAVPRMTILAPADAEEMKRVMPLTVDHHGPIYIRLGKGGDPIAADACIPSKIGQAFPITSGNDATIISTGITLKAAIDAGEELTKKGISASVVHVPTVKPLDRHTLLEYCGKSKVVVTVEEHTVIGGLGSAVAELLLENEIGPIKFRRIGIPDVFPDKYGSQASLMDGYGINADNIIHVVKELFTRNVK